ncbi:adhesion G protein-coupled receptor E3-like [Lissotriton helveticus]
MVSRLVMELGESTGGILRSPQDIANKFAICYENLYRSKSTRQESEVTDLLSEMQLPQLTEEDKVFLDSDLYQEEIAQTIRTLQLGKAMGPNGLPIERYKLKPDRIAPYLKSMYKESLEKRCLLQDQRIAMLVVIHKEGKPRNIDECAHSSTPCGPYSVCKNTQGSYSCKCMLGFSRRSVKNSTIFCTDIDECVLTPAACGPNTTCINTPGNYSCGCMTGFIHSAEGEQTNRTNICTDIDECARSSITCGPHSICTNTPGNYSCKCMPGFSDSRTRSLQNSTIFCTDIDECTQTSSACGPHTICTNTPGNYSCRCMPGFIFSAEGEQTNGTINCTEVTLNCESEKMKACQNRSNQDPFCSLLGATYGVIRDSCENKKATIELQKVTEDFSRVLEQISVSANLSSQNRSTIATVIIETIQSTILASLSKLDGNGSKRIETEQFGVELKAVEGGCNERNPLINLSAQQNQMHITCRTITGNRDQASIGVGFISFTDMNLILNGSFFNGSNTDSPETLRDIEVNSRVVSGQITSDKRSNFSEPVIFNLEHLKDKDNRQEVICVFWDSTEGAGSWSRQGCTLSNSNRTHTACSCTHLSIFAVIMAFKDVHDQDNFPLLVLTYVGLTFSLLCLSLAILTFLFCSSSRNTSTPMHLQLCICLFLAELLLLTGLDKTSNRIGCAIIAGILQYFFLASFSWMFVEALMLFLTVRNLNVANYFNTRKIKTPHLCLFGYGFPLLIVIISAASKPDSYGTSRHCWLNSATGHVWSFLGPVCGFILINSTLFITTLVILAQKLSGVNANVSTIKDTRLLTFKAGAQLLILGCTWILGLFQIESAAQIMAYLFTIINSFQGAFILLVHCILNRQVREEYLRWFRRMHKPTRESQSSRITMSTAAAPSKSLKDGNTLTSGHSAVTQNTTSSSTVDWNSATAL